MTFISALLLHFLFCYLLKEGSRKKKKRQKIRLGGWRVRDGKEREISKEKENKEIIRNPGQIKCQFPVAGRPARQSALVSTVL